MKYCEEVHRLYGESSGCGCGGWQQKREKKTPDEDSGQRSGGGW